MKDPASVNAAAAQVLRPLYHVCNGATSRAIAYVSVGTLAELLDISPATIWDWVKHGHLPRPIKIGGSSRWRWSDVEKHLTHSRENSEDDQNDPILKASRG